MAKSDETQAVMELKGASGRTVKVPEDEIRRAFAELEQGEDGEAAVDQESRRLSRLQVSRKGSVERVRVEHSHTVASVSGEPEERGGFAESQDGMVPEFRMALDDLARKAGLAMGMSLGSAKTRVRISSITVKSGSVEGSTVVLTVSPDEGPGVFTVNCPFTSRWASEISLIEELALAFADGDRVQPSLPLDDAPASEPAVH